MADQESGKSVGWDAAAREAQPAAAAPAGAQSGSTGLGTQGGSLTGLSVDGKGVTTLGASGGSLTGLRTNGGSPTGLGANGGSPTGLGTNGGSLTGLGANGGSPTGLGTNGGSLTGLGTNGGSLTGLGTNGGSLTGLGASGGSLTGLGTGGGLTGLGGSRPARPEPAPAAPGRPSGIRIHESAAARIRKLLEDRGTPGAALRIRVRGGGCTGLQYDMEFTDEPKERDRVFSEHGVRVVVDPKSYIFLIGTEITYETKLLESGFKLQNPNVKKSCGCGESFTV